MEAKEKALPGLTGFGTCLYKIMLSRGLRTFTELGELLRQNGHAVSKGSMSNYVTGKRSVPRSFVNNLVEVLNLDEEEQAALAWAFAYGQG